MQVKGTWLSLYVRIIRKFTKDNPEKKELFDKYLLPEDWELMKQFVLPSQKYPYEYFQRIGTAVFKVIAQANLQTVRAFGSIFILDLLKTYQNILVKNDPVASLNKFCVFHAMYFVEVQSKAVVLESNDNSALLMFILTDEDKKYEGAIAMAYQLAGSFENLISLTGKVNIKLIIEEDKDKNFLYHVTWE
jgi:hypothetical protein